MKASIMKEMIPNWLDNPLLSHVQACCIRLSTGETHVQVAGTEPVNEDFERAMKLISAVVPMLNEQQLMPGEMVWHFAEGKIHYAVRPDGAALGVYCKPGSDQESVAVNAFVSDFVRLGGTNFVK
ncbi:MAG TPA: hypothetical protein VK327_11995 [Candidatus Paceibacterota bacterium]|nr:hypothetical protein [Candidatus Paceibacterota bacterium]